LPPYQASEHVSPGLKCNSRIKKETRFRGLALIEKLRSNILFSLRLLDVSLRLARMRRRVIQIFRPHHQLDIERAKVGDKTPNRFKGESMEIGLRREAIPLAHQASHQLAVVNLSLFFFPMHMWRRFKSIRILTQGARTSSHFCSKSLASDR